MNVTVQFFSFLRQAAGTTQVALDLPAGATVGDLLAELYRRHPPLAESEKTTLIAIGVEFARRENPLKEGDVVSLMPPLQGGADGVELVITDQPIDEHEAGVGSVAGDIGGIVVFWGVVRDLEDGRSIAALDYTAYREMAEHQFRQLIAETKHRWPIKGLRVIHRLGMVKAGEASLLVRVEASHRAEAFAAAEFLIAELKKKVPIWKQGVRAG